VYSFGIFETNHTYMKNSGPINTVVINGKKFSLTLLPIWVGSLLLAVALGIMLQQYVITIIGGFIFLVPFIFEKRIRKPFCKNAEVQFFEEYFSVTMSNIDSGEVEYTDVNKYSEIDSFITSFNPKNDMYSLRLYFKDASNIKYTFCGTRYSNVSYAGQGVYLPKSRVLHTDISEIFFLYAKEYNNANPDNTITIHPAYFATNESRGTVITVSIFIVAAITIVSFLKPQILPACLIPVLFFYAVVIGSKTGYKRDMKNLSQA